MQIYNEINNKNKGIAIALGFFDGMHLGHRKLITTMVQKAKEKNIKTAVITFSENPDNYFDKKIPNIQTIKEKELILEKLEVDYMYQLDFELYKNMTGYEYLTNVLVENFEPKDIVIGYNHTFGCDFKKPDFIQDNSSKFGYECTIIQQETYEGHEVSSSAIRKHLEAGHLNAVGTLLKQNFSIRNSVIKGKNLATNLGCPTANLIWPDNIVKLPFGVYFGYAIIADKTTPCLISWGTTPTVSNIGESKLEAHIYKYDENLYGKIIKLVFIKKLRDQVKFDNIMELKEQIANDYEVFENWASARYIP